MGRQLPLPAGVTAVLVGSVLTLGAAPFAQAVGQWDLGTTVLPIEPGKGLEPDDLWLLADAVAAVVISVLSVLLRRPRLVGWVLLWTVPMLAWGLLYASHIVFGTTWPVWYPPVDGFTFRLGTATYLMIAGSAVATAGAAWSLARPATPAADTAAGTAAQPPATRLRGRAGFSRRTAAHSGRTPW